MFNEDQLKLRKPLWQAFSDLWLDNELQDFEINYKVNLMKSSNYELNELEKIFYEEVAPAVYKNTFSMTGEWSGFDSEWLKDAIFENLLKQESNSIYRTWVNSSAGRYLMTKMVIDDWRRIVNLYKYS